MKTIWNGPIKNYIQLGTVMTAPPCRKQGLSRFLMEEIKKDWEGRCDGMYLFANDTVLDFYPKFGFSRQEPVSYTHLDVYKRQPLGFGLAI